MSVQGFGKVWEINHPSQLLLLFSDEYIWAMILDINPHSM